MRINWFFFCFFFDTSYNHHSSFNFSNIGRRSNRCAGGNRVQHPLHLGQCWFPQWLPTLPRRYNSRRSCPADGRTHRGPGTPYGHVHRSVARRPVPAERHHCTGWWRRDTKHGAPENEWVFEGTLALLLCNEVENKQWDVSFCPSSNVS